MRAWLCVLSLYCVWCQTARLAPAPAALEQAEYKHHRFSSRAAVHAQISAVVRQVTFEGTNVTVPAVHEIACPKGCLKHGHCNFTNGACTCNLGFHGDACETAYRCQDYCNYRGVCIEDGVCSCEEGFAGDACEEDQRCPDDCSGHGTCLNGGLECVCAAGWRGETCGVRQVPLIDPRSWSKRFPSDTSVKAGALPSGRRFHQVVVNGAIENKQVLMWGGQVGDKPLDDMWVFDVTASQWFLQAQHGIRPGPRHSHAMASTLDGAFLFGGFEPCEGVAAFSSELWFWSFVNQTWTRLPMILDTGLEAGPAGRTQHTMVTIGESLFVFGGVGNEGVPFSDLWRYSISTGIWHKLTSSPFGSRHSHSASVTSSDEFYVFGGADGDETLHDSLFKYTMSLDTWEAINASGTPPSARSGHTSLFHAGKLFVFGGSSGGGAPLSDFWAFDLTSTTWAQVVTSGPVPSTLGVVAVGMGDVGVLIGGVVGQTADDEPDATVSTLDVGSGTFTTVLASGGVPQKRILQSANIFSDRLWVFGGLSASGQALRDLWDFDLRGGMWTEHAPTLLSNQDSPSAVSCGTIVSNAAGSTASEAEVLWPSHRAGHATTVLSGRATLCPKESTLVLFGGAGLDGQALDDLWYWCSTQLKWHAIGSEDSVRPPARSKAAVVVSGDVLIVFGGVNGENLRLNDLWQCTLVNGACTEIIPETGERPHTRRSMHLHVDLRSTTPQLVMFNGYWREENACSECGGVIATSNSNLDRPLDVYVYQNQYHRWRKSFGRDGPEQRFCAGTFLHGPKMYMFGGFSTEGVLEHNDLWYFNLDALQWRRLPAARDEPVPPGRHDHTLDMWFDATTNITRAVVYGGIGLTGMMNDVWVTTITDAQNVADFNLLESEGSASHFVKLVV
eukprot:c112_g1_i1.p1 GENE.c112_g1_i1~~c112_g1_i1.p1  ORF type:complete len:907 (-),score=158.59 c112_g1_i1:54-2750(-)